MANNLTPQLNADQLKANIDALQKGGMKTADIQTYVNNYKSDGNGGYVLASGQSPASPPPQRSPSQILRPILRAIQTLTRQILYKTFPVNQV